MFLYLIWRKVQLSNSSILDKTASLNELLAQYYIGHDSPISLLTVGEKGNIMHISDGFKQRPVGPLRAHHIYEDSILSPSGECHRSSKKT